MYLKSNSYDKLIHSAQLQGHIQRKDYSSNYLLSTRFYIHNTYVYMSNLKTIIRILSKMYPGEFIRDVRFNDDETVTFKAVRKDDTWRELTEKV